jgi:hypothetical protein
MSSDSLCQVARRFVDAGSFHTHLVVRFMIFTASVRNILDCPRMRGIGFGFVTEARDISLSKVFRMNLEPTQSPLSSRLTDAGSSSRPYLFIWRRV